MSSVPVPGPSGLLSRPSFEKDGKRGIATLRRKPRCSIERKVLFGAQLRDGFRSCAKAPGESDGQNIRDNNAAWVAGPGRICFVCLSLSAQGVRSSQGTGSDDGNFKT